MTGELDSFSGANRVKRSIEKISTDAIDRLRPPSKTAEVREINLEQKYCMVVYLGEPSDNLVKVPFSNVVPSFIGQFVRISGMASDRVISEVMGATATETNVDALTTRVTKLENQPLPGSVFMECTVPTSAANYRTTGSVQRAPFSQATVPSAVFDIVGSLGARYIGTFAGVFMVSASWKFAGTGFTGGDDVHLEIEARNQSNVVNFRKTSHGFGEITLNVQMMMALNPQDFICANVWSGKWRDHGSGDLGSQVCHLGAHLLYGVPPS